MKINSQFDELFPNVAHTIGVWASDLIENDANPIGVGLAMIIAGSELLTAITGPEAAADALRGARAHIVENIEALKIERERLLAAA